VCVFPVFWEGPTMRQGFPCKEEQRSQGTGKMCNRAGSAVNQQVTVFIEDILI